MKCFTNVVDDGLNKCKYPLKLWSASVVKLSPIVWNAVDCAKS